MALPPDSASSLIIEIGKELQRYEDNLALIGILFAGKFALNLSLSLYRGFREHIWPKFCPTTQLTEKFGRWALVTGATEGIGKAFAEELAKRGVNIILMDADEIQLNNVSAEIEQETGVETKIFQTNFEDFELSETVAAAIHDLEVGILVNSYQGCMPEVTPFYKMAEIEVEMILNANIKSVTLLSKTALLGMLRRNKGIILNFLAFSGIYPIPFISVFSASKAYVEFFSRALSEECKCTNVKVQTLVPGFLHLQEDEEHELYDLNAILPSAAQYAKNTIDALGVAQTYSGYWAFSLEMLNYYRLFASHRELTVRDWLFGFLNDTIIQIKNIYILIDMTYTKF